MEWIKTFFYKEKTRLIHNWWGGKSSKKQKNPLKSVGLSVNAEGFEPSTACLEGRCSIQLSYASIYLLKLKWKKFNLSGWQDSNLRPPAPKAGAITGLRYTPKTKKRRVRDSNPWYSFPYACLANMSFRPLRQLSNIRTYIPFKRLQM